MTTIFDINEIKVLSNGDWDLSSYVSNTNAINQNIRVRLNEIKNNCFFSMDEGVDIETLSKKTIEEVAELIKQIIQNTVGITQVNLLSYQKTLNKLELLYNYSTIYDENFQFTVSF